MADNETTAERLLRELWEVIQAPLDYLNDTDASADLREQDPEGFERAVVVMNEVYEFLNARGVG